MALEPDECKWVGIRPTDPSENIPVTESAPLTDILVAPSAGNPQFQTLTKKRSPAIADISAIELFRQMYFTYTAVADADYTKVSPAVPAGKIYVITYIMSFSDDAGKAMSHYIETGGAGNAWINRILAPAVEEPLVSSGNIVLDEGQRLGMKVFNLLTGKKFNCGYTGYQISKY